MVFPDGRWNPYFQIPDGSVPGEGAGGTRRPDDPTRPSGARATAMPCAARWKRRRVGACGSLKHLVWAQRSEVLQRSLLAHPVGLCWFCRKSPSGWRACGRNLKESREFLIQWVLALREAYFCHLVRAGFLRCTSTCCFARSSWSSCAAPPLFSHQWPMDRVWDPRSEAEQMLGWTFDIRGTHAHIITSNS